MQRGFTLAELLISLAILGIIATFTIAKVLNTQQDNGYNSAAKEAAAMLSGAYYSLQSSEGVTADTQIGDMTQFMNYVSVYTGLVDDAYTDTFLNCATVNYGCLKLHNGGIVAYRANVWFGGTDTTNGLPFFFDPDGEYGGTTNGPGKSVSFFLFFNGRLVDRGNIPAGTGNSLTTYGAAPSKTPPWFQW
ncbi:MAG: type II secretion system protein [Vampirovibrionales bacterium]|nr:type II secretion system protein [Vampirovibrionales bacterium]